MTRYLVYRAEDEVPDTNDPKVLHVTEAHDRKTDEPSWLVLSVTDERPDPSDDSIGACVPFLPLESPDESMDRIIFDLAARHPEGLYFGTEWAEEVRPVIAEAARRALASDDE